MSYKQSDVEMLARQLAERATRSHRRQLHGMMRQFYSPGQRKEFADMLRAAKR